MAKKWVYLFEEVTQAEDYAGSWEGVRGLLGGKGSGLADMTRAGVPVPPGFTVTTEACNEFRKTGSFPEGQWEQQIEAMKVVEEQTGKKFGDATNPLLVSCRSNKPSQESIKPTQEKLAKQLAEQQQTVRIGQCLEQLPGISRRIAPSGPAWVAVVPRAHSSPFNRGLTSTVRPPGDVDFTRAAGT